MKMFNKFFKGENVLGTIANWFAILGTVISCYFAFISIQLTKFYGDSKDQINRLDSLSQTQKVQVDTLVNILRELRIQNALAQEQNIELKSQGKEIFTQTNSVNEQLNLNRSIQSQNISLSLLQRKSNFIRLRDLVRSLMEIWAIRGVDKIDVLTNQQRIGMLSETLSYLKEGLSNPILLENDSVSRNWGKLYNYTKLTIDEQRADWTNVVIVNTSPITREVIESRDSISISSIMKDDFKRYRTELMRYQTYFIDHIVKKGVKELYPPNSDEIRGIFDF